MFSSRTRPVVYSQYEHARLAGIIAQHWGNAQFGLPSLPFDAFCAGVAFHDHGYGVIDTHDILAMEQQERRDSFEAMLATTLPDPIADIVASMHLARLVQWSGLPEFEEKVRRKIRQDVEHTDFCLADFESADTLTQLCDAIAFDFCLEQDSQGSVSIDHCKPGTGSSDVKYEICFSAQQRRSAVPEISANIRLNPWPLSTNRIHGYLIAFDRGLYPQELRPYRVEFRLEADSETRPAG